MKSTCFIIRWQVIIILLSLHCNSSLRRTLNTTRLVPLFNPVTACFQERSKSCYESNWDERWQRYFQDILNYLLEKLKYRLHPKNWSNSLGLVGWLRMVESYRSTWTFLTVRVSFLLFLHWFESKMIAEPWDSAALNKSCFESSGLNSPDLDVHACTVVQQR